MRPLSIPTPDGCVSLEPFAATLRFHGEGGSYGSPFTFSCTLTAIGTEARLFAGRGEVTPATWRALAHALREAGFEQVIFERRNKPRKRRRRVKLDVATP